MTSYSTLTILLILIAALSTPAAAVNRKLQRRKGRKLSRSGEGKNSKCAKNQKSSCVKVTFVDDEIETTKQKNDLRINYGYGFGPKKVPLQWIAFGLVDRPEGAKNTDYVYLDVKRERQDGLFGVICHIDVCMGVNEDEVKDCVYIRGQTKGKLNPEAQTFEDVSFFNAMVIGGTGRFTGSIGAATVDPTGDNDGDSEGWVIELDASISTWYTSDDPEKPKSKEFSAMFTALP